MRKDIDWPESYLILGTPFGTGGSAIHYLKKLIRLDSAGSKCTWEVRIKIGSTISIQ